MSSQKNRDLAQELVDFLLKEDQQSESATAVSSTPPVPQNRVEEKKSGGISRPSMAPPPLPGGSPLPAPIANPAASAIPPLPQMPPPLPKRASPARDEHKTFVLEETEPDRHESKNKADAKTKTDTISKGKSGQVVEFTALSNVGLGDVVPESVNFITPSEKTSEMIKGGKPDGTKTEDFHFQPTAVQGFTTQRSKVVFNEVSTLMAGAEAVKVAQARISSLERERDKLRDESEQLLTASETLQRRLQELKAENESLERKHKEKVEILEDEKAVAKGRLAAKEEELERVRKENEELKLRFQSDLRKIRVRERELEARQEIMKAENISIMKVKDETILELRRQLEKMQFELENFRSQAADMNARISDFHERNHRTVKALRLALSVLETGDSNDKTRKVG